MRNGYVGEMNVNHVRAATCITSPFASHDARMHNKSIVEMKMNEKY